ncbi:hypothetical protein MKY91_17255 [Alkalicoccobacillus gibsonii]|uniref:TcaA second domain-containing protein n=1 Tax=Alkalicoccobacillus gibsonii TaxID=79881 RepID=A0ABU9VPU5_9BACI
MSRTKWYVIGGSGIVLGGILFFSGQAVADKEKVLDSFLEAVAERDQAAVKKALVSNHPEQDVDDEHVEAFFDVLDNSSEAHGELIQKDVFDRGIRQRFSGAEATNVTLNDDDSYMVETREEYEIRPKDGECTSLLQSSLR